MGGLRMLLSDRGAPETQSRVSRSPRDGTCIGGIAYAFPSESRSVQELAASGLLESDAAVLEGFGFSRVRVAACETPYELAQRAASQLLAEREIAADNIDVLIYGGSTAIAFAQGSPAAGDNPLRTTARFKYPGTRLQYDLGLVNASVMGLDQLACTSLFGAVRIARALCNSEGINRVLCVASEFAPADAGREAIYNCTSDAACAILIEREGLRNRIVASTQVTKGYYWDCDAMRNEIVASYFPTSRYVIAKTVADAGWAPADVDWVISHNVSMRSWEILMRLLALPRARLWSSGIARDGHTLAGDNFINLRDALDTGSVRAGDKLILFSYGYGAHWSALAVEA